MPLLVILEHDRGELADAAREALTAGRDLAEQMSVDLHAVVIGEGADDLTDEVEGYGAETIHVVTHHLLTDYGPDAWAESVRQLADELDAEAVMSVGTDRGNEVLAQLAARTGLPFVANCTSIDASDDDSWSMTRVQWGGSLLEDATLQSDRKLVTFAHHAVAASEQSVASGSASSLVEEFEPELDDSHAVTIIKDRVVETSGVTLSTAPVVISGGRGVGSADGFAILDELAELLGGRVGCSRAVTNNGWRPHADQVGQTGTRIAPEIYIATGISGAIQHWVGAMASKRILAINTDPEANMVTKADYAVIADLHKVIPAITAEVKRRKGL
ncbi:MAG: electron transfer flavoprotein subunit alpha/FixB family protein [Acidimicrobiia bacterium]|nr:electron transfer flavoprotein subunit alpha/FixB family protein [Acidimicrobiia bacterium]